MGLLDVDGALPNFTKCSTWKHIKESHTSAKLVEIRLHDVYGMLVLLSIGLIGSALGLAVEKSVRKSRRSRSQICRASKKKEAQVQESVGKSW